MCACCDRSMIDGEHINAMPLKCFGFGRTLIVSLCAKRGKDELVMSSVACITYIPIFPILLRYTLAIGLSLCVFMIAVLWRTSLTGVVVSSRNCSALVRHCSTENDCVDTESRNGLISIFVEAAGTHVVTYFVEAAGTHVVTYFVEAAGTHVSIFVEAAGTHVVTYFVFKVFAPEQYAPHIFLMSPSVRDRGTVAM